MEDEIVVIEHYNELLGLQGTPQAFFAVYDGMFSPHQIVVIIIIITVIIV